MCVKLTLKCDITGCEGPTLRAKGGVGVNSVCMAWACLGCLCGPLQPSVCVILWTERSRTAARVGDGGRGVFKVPVSHPSVLWRSGVARVGLCLMQPETPYFFCYPVGMTREK